MVDPDRQRAVLRELAVASEASRAAISLQWAALHRDAMSRLYHAAHHWACALLAAEGIQVRGRRRLRELFAVHCVAGGRIESKHLETLARLDTWRKAADYEPAFEIRPELFEEEIERASELEQRVVELLREAGYEINA